jgi:hypothetical protein
MHSFLKNLTSLDSINHEVFLENFLTFFIFLFVFELFGFHRSVPLPCCCSKNGNCGYRRRNGW